MKRKPKINAYTRLSACWRSPFRPSPLVVLLANALLAPAVGQAQGTLPSGMNVVAGQANASLAGKQLTITNSANTILNWQSFSIGAGNTVQFVQPGATSQVLNRVMGNDPSTLLGSLTSNGRVWLLNPNGVLFGQGARVDVGSLVVSTLAITNEDWLAGSLHFGADTGITPAAIDNQGTLHGSLGGRVVLIGGAVSNEGVIDAPGGQVLLAAGRSVDLVDTGAPNLSVHVGASAGEVRNLGQLSADGGRIDVYAAAVNQQGIVRADSLGNGPGGTVVLAASDQLTLAGGSTTRADSAGAQGGQVQLTGRHVALEDGSVVGADGARGGGTVLAGGGAQGRDADVPRAEALFFARGARIDANALASGDGGHIVLWSDRATRAYGTLSARGGAAGGNGGLVETSGGWLDARPLSLDVGAAHGLAGQWLLDPYDVVISDSASDSGFDASFNATGNASISSATLTQALNSGTNVTVQTGGGSGTSAGDISLASANILVTAAVPGSLTLVADHDITMTRSTIDSTGGAMAVSFFSGRAGLGGIALSGSTISTDGGAIFLGGYGTALDAAGVAHHNAAVNDPQDSYYLANYGYGVSVDNTSVLDAGSGDISIVGTSAMSGYAGVFLGDATLGGHDISVIGSTTAPALSESGSSGADVTATLAATHSIDIQGNSLSGTGAEVDNATLSVTPAATDTTASLTIAGATSAQVGTNLYGSSLTVSRGATLNVSGTGTDSTYPALVVSGNDSQIPMTFDASNAGGAITLSASRASKGMSIDFTTFEGSAAGVTLTVPGNLEIDLAETQITSAGPVRLTGGAFSFTDGVAITANGTGDAIVARASSGGISSFTSDNDPFSAPNGRWIVWLSDPGALNASLPDYGFQRFGVTSVADWSGDAGNGLVYSQTQSVTVTGAVASRPYDGTLAAQTSNLAATPADSQLLRASVSSTAYAQFGDKNAGTGKAVSLFDSRQASPVNVTDAQSKPVYGATIVSSLAGDITPRTLTGTLVVDKVYDASALYGTGVTNLVGLVGSETVNVSASGSFASKNVGRNLPVSATYQTVDGANGGLAANYSYSGPRTALGTITPLAISITGLSATNKVYDATTSDTPTGSATVTPLSGDSLSVVGTPQLTFSDANAGSNKSVAVSGLTLGSSDAGNYTLIAPGPFTATITPRPLTGTLVVDKVYDTSALYSTGVTNLVGLVGSQTVVVTANGSFASKIVGQNRPVSVSYQTADGANGGLAGNYRYSGPSTAQGTITPLALTLSGLSAADKVYDATRAATAIGTATVTPLAGDTVDVNTGQLDFADANVGRNKSVSVNGFGLAGPDAGNYTLASPAPLTASITPASLAYVANALTLADGDALATLQGRVVGFVGSDTLSTATTGTAVFTSAIQGTSGVTSGNVTAAPGRYAIDGSGLSAGNYVFTQDPGNATALTVTFPRQVDTPASQDAVFATNVAMASQRPRTDPGRGGVIDVTGVYPLADSGSLFGAWPLSDMAPGSVAALLSARDDFMNVLLGGALGQLALQPGLADLPVCQSMKDAASGTCLVTDALKREAREARAGHAGGAIGAASSTTPAPAAATTAPGQQPTAAAGSTVANATNSANEANAPSVVAAALPAVPHLSPPSVSPLFNFRRVRSATLPQIEHKVAVLIGVDDYQDNSIPRLTHAVGDAQAMSELFMQRLGYETVSLSSPTRSAVVATLNRLALEMGPRDSVLVYFAGHGAVVEAEGAGKGEGYWLLGDSQATKPETWLSNADIARLLGVIDAQQVALISDSCYSGRLASGTRIGVNPDLGDAGRILSRRAEVVMSSGGNEPVFDAGKNGHSPFAWNLLDTLGQTSGWTPGGRIFQRVRFQVARELPQHPQYAAAANHQADADYLFEQRQLGAN